MKGWMRVFLFLHLGVLVGGCVMEQRANEREAACLEWEARVLEAQARLDSLRAEAR